MKEKNLDRAKKICSQLETYRSKINQIDTCLEIENTFEMRIRTDKGWNNIYIKLGDEINNFILTQYKKHLLSSILELEAELEKL